MTSCAAVVRTYPALASRAVALAGGAVEGEARAAVNALGKAASCTKAACLITGGAAVIGANPVLAKRAVLLAGGAVQDEANVAARALGEGASGAGGTGPVTG